PGVPGDQGCRRDGQQSVRRELHLSGQLAPALRRAVRHRGGADGDLVHLDVLGALVPHRADADGPAHRAADLRRIGAGGMRLLHPVRPSLRSDRAQEADRDRLCADAGAAVPAVLGDRRGGQSGTGGGGEAHAGGRAGARLCL
ncbi:hypothetical protein QU38_01385, partial [Staphylococcus aureus]